jgi:hypothetical protein
MTEMSRQELERRMVARAGTDDDFRARLIADPRAAIAEELGAEVDEAFEFEVLEPSPEKIYLVLPPKAETLSDEELESVAGGFQGDAQAEIERQRAHQEQMIRIMDQLIRDQISRGE